MTDVEVRMTNDRMRPWYRLHLSTLSVLAIVLASLVFINFPGDRMLRDSNRYHHGWPYFYFERDGESRAWWSFAGASPEVHVGALALNLLTTFCIAALAACACEIWIRRYGRLFRFSITSMLLVTALLAVIMGILVRNRNCSSCGRMATCTQPLVQTGAR